MNEVRKLVRPVCVGVDEMSSTAKVDTDTAFTYLPGTSESSSAEVLRTTWDTISWRRALMNIPRFFL